MVNSSQNKNASVDTDFDRINENFIDAYYREIVD